MAASEFLRDYWQKKPLLIRGAMPGFGGDLNRQGLLALAARDDVESRFVAHDDKHWSLRRGPFSPQAARRWRGQWTVLVQGVDLVLPAASRLLAQFNFIPWARLDDVMVSYATDGAGVGPHIDNYDVFLLQGAGKRRWRIGRPRNRALIDGAPLKILREFVPDEEYVLSPGDMLYLPPDWAHDGIAEGECMTWSIGFRTAPATELAAQFLAFMQEHLEDLCELPGRYADPDLTVPRHPGEIDAAMIRRTRKLLDGLRWNDAIVRDFLGINLTEPKPHVVFDAPVEPKPRAAFGKALKRLGVALDARSRLLFSGERVFLNGELEDTADAELSVLHELADNRVLPSGLAMSSNTIALLHDWYRCGFLHLANEAKE